MATLLETDIAHLSENIAQQYAIPAQYFEDQSIKRGLRNDDGTGTLERYKKDSLQERGRGLSPANRHKKAPEGSFAATLRGKDEELLFTCGGSRPG